MNAKKILMTIFVAIAFLISACSALATPQPTPTPVPTPTPTTARFEGTIYFLEKPFVGAMVSLGDPSKDAEDPSYRVAEVTTDEQGNYAFVVDPGQYTLGATLVFESPLDHPCENISMPMGWISTQATPDASPADSSAPWWFGVWGSRSDGAQILIASLDSVTVVAGDVVQRDMYVACDF